MPESHLATYRDAIIEALAEEMRRDPTVVLMGEDIGNAGGVFQQTKGLFAEFGARRVIDTPISEAGSFGMAVGGAMAGIRPVFEVMFDDFMTLIMDQLVNQAAKVSYMSNGRVSVPLVVRTSMGVGSNLGPQHSQLLYAWACHVPGLKVAVPSSADDAKGIFKAAIRDNGPVVIFEDRLLYGQKADIPNEETLIPFGKAVVKRVGEHATIIAIGRMVQHALKASAKLEAEGIQVEVIDPRSLVPLDLDTLCASVQKTNRVLVVDGAPAQYGAAAEIAAILSEETFDWLDAPVQRLCGANIPIPISRSLEPLVQPNSETIVAAVKSLMVGSNLKSGAL